MTNVRLRVRCVNPPVTSETIRFGLQDKNGNLVTGDVLEDGSLQFSFELRVKQTDSGAPNFLGDFAHGSVKERFLYLTTTAQERDDWRIVRRIKVHLKLIAWEQVEAAAHPDAVLAVSVDGRGTASVPLLGDGWIVT